MGGVASRSVTYGGDIHMRGSILAGLCAILAGAGGSASAAQQDENVLTPMPSGFKMGYHTAQGAMTMAEYVPAGESVDAWSTMITVQIYHGQPNRDPEAFASNLGARWNASCTNATSVKVVNGYENGYPFAVWAYECPLNPATHKPENMWMKAISGADSLYAVQYADRQAMSPALVAPAMAYLRKVAVCDTRRPDRRCPKGM